MPQPGPTGEAFILRLPDELLNDIFASPVLFGEGWYRWITYASVSATCKRFHTIVQPLLYYKVHLNLPMALPDILLCRTIMMKPALQTLCKCLSLYVDSSGIGGNDASFANKFLPLLTNVRSLKIDGGFDDEHFWAALCNAVQHMPLINDLKMEDSDEWHGPLLESICKDLHLPALRTLRLHGAGIWEEDIFPPSHCRRPENVVPGDKMRTATFTTLNLSAFQFSPKFLERFVMWPKALEHFTFHDWISAVIENDREYNLHVLEPMLRLHRESLKSITLGELLCDDQGAIDVSDFPKLESLQVPADALGYPEAIVSKLSAPQLHTLALYYRTEDSDVEPWGEFAPSKAERVRRFAELASARGSSLRNIRILFSPCERGPAHTIEYPERLRYPWDLMDELRDAIQPLGINLSYTSPTISREKFKKMAIFTGIPEDSDEDGDEGGDEETDEC